MLFAAIAPGLFPGADVGGAAGACRARYAYAAIVSTGVFTTGHVGVEGLPELFRIARPGGLIVLSVRVTVWESGFADYLKQKEAKGVVEALETTPIYASMPAGSVTSPCVAVALSRAD